MIRTRPRTESAEDALHWVSPRQLKRSRETPARRGARLGEASQQPPNPDYAAMTLVELIERMLGGDL